MTYIELIEGIDDVVKTYAKTLLGGLGEVSIGKILGEDVYDKEYCEPYEQETGVDFFDFDGEIVLYTQGYVKHLKFDFKATPFCCGAIEIGNIGLSGVEAKDFVRFIESLAEWFAHSAAYFIINLNVGYPEIMSELKEYFVRKIHNANSGNDLYVYIIPFEK